MADILPPSDARARHDAIINSLGESARTYLRDGEMPLHDFLEIMQRPNLRMEDLSRAFAGMLSDGSIELTWDRKVRLTERASSDEIDALDHSREYDPTWPGGKPYYCNECDEALTEDESCCFNAALRAVKAAVWDSAVRFAWDDSEPHDLQHNPYREG